MRYVAVLCAVLLLVASFATAQAANVASPQDVIASHPVVWGAGGLRTWWHAHGAEVKDVLACGATGIELGLMIAGVGGGGVGLVVAGITCLL